MKKNSIFKKFTIVYFLILTVLCGLFIYYVVDSLILYENSEVEKYISNLVVDISQDAKRNRIGKYIDLKEINVSKYENTNTDVSEAYANIFKTKEITYELVEGTIKTNPTYKILADNELLFTIKLKSDGDVHRMGLLSFPNWVIDEVTFDNNRGVYFYDLYTLEDYKVIINDKVLSKSSAVDSKLDNDLDQISKYTKIPKVVKYELSDLTTEPNIKVFDGKKEVKISKIGKTIEAYELFATNNIDELTDKLASKIDVINIAEMWSKFLTDDLSGSYHGYSTIKEYLIEDTDLWNMAYQWSHGVDITFVSNHTLIGFANEKVSNCVLYSENAFSCDIYLEKNMRLKSGKAKQDIMNDKFYFVNYDNAWKIVSMKALTEN